MSCLHCQGGGIDAVLWDAGLRRTIADDADSKRLWAASKRYACDRCHLPKHLPQPHETKSPQPHVEEAPGGREERSVEAKAPQGHETLTHEDKQAPNWRVELVLGPVAGEQAQLDF